LTTTMQVIYLPQSLDARSSYGVHAFRSHFARPVVFVPRRPRLPLLSVKAAKDPSGPKVAIAGISGAVGQEFIRVLTERNFPYSEIKMLASSR